MKYSVEWLINRYENGLPLEFIFFWGHTSKNSGEIDKQIFSQWFQAAFTVGEIRYKTVEHYMMAHKALLFNDIDSFSKIIASNSPSEAKELGRQIRNFNNDTWNNRKYGIVKTGNIHKFNQNPELSSFLISTGDQIIAEASPVDMIWGIGLAQENPHINNLYMWRGENLLGFALMEVRDFLNEYGHFKPSEFNPPWIQYPEKHPTDMFWRMGKGEEILSDFSRMFSQLSEDEKTFYQLTYPAPPKWEEFY